jgi:tRNA (mo5U34)-methyltransferase
MSSDLSFNIESHRWFHSIDLGNGIVTRGVKTQELHKQESFVLFDRLNMVGRTVLDIGAWDGYYSFDAKRRGASRVLATDSYAWELCDGKRSFDIANKALGSNVEALQIDAGDISPSSVGTFDIVLFLGVFYHRIDAITTLQSAASVTNQLLIVETHLDLRELPFPAMAFYPGSELNNDPSNWWGPNELCMIDLLTGCGFNEIESSAHPAGSSRAIFHAWRDTSCRLCAVPPHLRLKPKRRLNFIKRLFIRGKSP